jgi:beta-aspartyl-peptidase (threonine type)
MKAITLGLLLIAMNTIAAPVAIVIHAGAGGKPTLPAALEKEYHTTLAKALRAGHSILKKGGSAMDAVEIAIVVMENSPLFNAGKGAVFTSTGENEMDASIMDGRTLLAGAVGGVTVIKNPIRAARAVMDKTPHVLLAGDGAEVFAKKAGLEIVPRKYFHTDRRWKQLQQWKAKQKNKKRSDLEITREYLGTVGCAALDSKGNIAAGTSTGGLTGKQYGRLGDSPIIAAGTYADNRTCAISCTGHGEFFIRHAVAFDISARMKYKNETIAQAANAVVQGTLKKVSGRGGVIGLDAKGNIVMEFNTHAMNRGYIDKTGKLHTSIFR